MDIGKNRFLPMSSYEPCVSWLATDVASETKQSKKK